ncbi:hypothetical protein LCGC14_1468280 [marine sediment metagenome]|uniref:Ice-binding protein C-terminal domain-containing protein n=1 Tax=marine sediment metagenome TaxID=412755 RepID=A0A0F9MEZ8_9ZZZZ
MNKPLAVVGLTFILFYSVISSTAYVAIGFTAEVTEFKDPRGWLGEPIPIGTQFTGFYMYDTLTPDSIPDNLQANQYYHIGETPCGFYVILPLGDNYFMTDNMNANFKMTISNNIDLPGDTPPNYDIYAFSSYNNISLENGVSVDLINWTLEGSEDTIDSRDLPLHAPTLIDWDVDWGLTIMGNMPGCECFDEFSIQSIVLEVHDLFVVPEPATILILGMGCLFVIRKRKSNKC